MIPIKHKNLLSVFFCFFAIFFVHSAQKTSVFDSDFCYAQKTLYNYLSRAPRTVRKLQNERTIARARARENALCDYIIVAFYQQKSLRLRGVIFIFRP
jgi:hypothetical protein